MAINEKELNEVSGGYGNWQQYAKGSYVNYGQYIVYTVVGGDVLSGIAIRLSRSALVSLCSRSASGTTSRTPTSSTSTRS